MLRIKAHLSRCSFDRAEIEIAVNCKGCARDGPYGGTLSEHPLQVAPSQLTANFYWHSRLTHPAVPRTHFQLTANLYRRSRLTPAPTFSVDCNPATTELSI
jgi:hypothetical protein